MSSLLSNHNHSRGYGVGERPDDYRVMNWRMADVVSTIHGGTYDCKGLLASQMLSMAILKSNIDLAMVNYNRDPCKVLGKV